MNELFRPKKHYRIVRMDLTCEHSEMFNKTYL